MPDATTRRPMCPCGSGEPAAACCGRLHSGQQRAATAEQLMRSRFSAFALGEEAYLLSSWHASTRPKRLRLDPGREWTHLEIVGRTGGGPFDTEGTVEFRAHHRAGGETGVLHENSRFVREGGAWLYVAAV
jgi:SEC-C motif domain protein